MENIWYLLYPFVIVFCILFALFCPVLVSQEEIIVHNRKDFHWQCIGCIRAQEFWAARQRIAAFNRTAGSETTSNNHAAECLLLRLDALEMQLRARLEAQMVMKLTKNCCFTSIGFAEVRKYNYHFVLNCYPSPILVLCKNRLLERFEQYQFEH